MAEKHYLEQVRYTREYLLPYLKKHLPGLEHKRILEIGCAEAGFLAVLQEEGIQGTGVELEEHRVRLALKKNPGLDIIQGDAVSAEVLEKLNGRFDLVVLRDVIEHIPERKRLMASLGKLLRKDGIVYISFPPRFSPFAGHQQNGTSCLRFVPYLQMWPPFLVRAAGRICGESSGFVEYIIHNFRTGLSVRRFIRICRETGLKSLVWELFLIRPVYRLRFKLKPRRLPNIPFLREILATGCEVLLQRSPQAESLTPASNAGP